MPTNKRYNIQKIGQIPTILTEENVELFIHDFADWCRYQVAMKDVKKTLPENLIIETQDSFRWIDDGIKGVSSVEIRVKFEE